jgi:hypothetical protein
MTNYQGIKGRYRPFDEDTEYLHVGRYTADFPSHWEAKVRRSDDRFRDVLKEFRVELSGPLVDIKTDPATLHALALSNRACDPGMGLLRCGSPLDQLARP